MATASSPGFTSFKSIRRATAAGLGRFEEALIKEGLEKLLQGKEPGAKHNHAAATLSRLLQLMPRRPGEEAQRRTSASAWAFLQ